MGINPMLPFSGAYHELERARLAEVIPPLVAARRPDLVILGRESFLWGAGPVVAALDLPAILVVHGGTTIGIAAGTHSPAEIAEFVAASRRMTRIITVGAHLAPTLAGLGLDRVTVIQNGVDLARFRPAPRDPALARALGVAADDVAVLFPGLLKTQKRPLDLVAAAALALAEAPVLRFVVCGDGPLREEVVAACRAHGILDRFRFAGWVPHEAMPAHYALADLVVLPSEGEGLALVYLEAQACARLLVTSDIPPAREVVADGETGLLVPRGDVAALARCLVTASRDAGLRARIGAEAARRAQRFGIEAVTDRYAAEIDAVLADPALAAAYPLRG
jgi:2-deoxystreptamine N-acetyl-D-glucosaminyltransferase/2-deoxystreptamine glucosyltransferase